MIHEVGETPHEICLKDKECLVVNRSGDSFPTFMYNIKKLWIFLNGIGTFYVWIEFSIRIFQKILLLFIEKHPILGIRWSKKFQILLSDAGLFSCRRCKACSQVNCPIRGLTEYTSSSNNKTFEISEFITCGTTHVVYVLQCPCNLMYVGHTKRT